MRISDWSSDVCSSDLVSRALQARGSLLPTEHGGLALGGDARAILKGEASVPIVVPPRSERKRRGGRDSGANPVGDPLFDALRTLRRSDERRGGKACVTHV